MVINSFRGEFRFLSNFYACPVFYEGVVWPTAEHAYQAAKTHDELGKNHIKQAKTAADAKALGSKVIMKLNWEHIKVGIMDQILRDKFGNHNIILQDKLMATEDAQLVEGNTWNDRFWGVCDGQGQNWLGRLLMGIREDIYLLRHYT